MCVCVCVVVELSEKWELGESGFVVDIGKGKEMVAK